VGIETCELFYHFKMINKMKTKHTFGVHFIIRPNKNEDGKSSIYARVVVNGTRTEISIKAFVLPDEWSASRGAAKSRNEALKLLNNYLEDVRGKLFTAFRDLKMEEGIMTAEAVKNSYLGVTGNDGQQTLLWLVKQHNTVMAKVLKYGSLKNYYTAEWYIQKFLHSKYPSGDIYLKHLRYEFITGFVHYIRTNSIKAGDPCTNNGTMKHLERLRKMVTWAVKNEWIGEDPFSNFKLHFKRTEREFLTEHELQGLASFELPNATLEKVRNMFLFSCFTGLSFIDLIALRPHQVVIGNDGIQWITTTRAKTATAVNIPLLQPAASIFASFAGNLSARTPDSRGTKCRYCYRYLTSK
jgi:Phage integrase SAM-like domain/Arm DNA-binding domain